MTVYTTLPTDDANLAVTVTDSNDLVTLNITPASVNVTSAVTTVNGYTGNVTLDTDDISEGSSNLYYTDARFDTRLATKTTDNLTEGSNLYFTTGRIDGHLTGGTGVTYNAGDISIGQDVATTSDVTFNTVTATDEFIGHIDGSVRFTAKNRSGATIEPGQVIYISGLSGNTPEVDLAQSNSSSTMPAFGIAIESIGNNNNGQFATFGSQRSLDIADWGESGITFSEGDILYVSATEAGHLTNVPPAGESNQIQNIGKLERATPTTNTTIKVGGAGRSNDTPNLNTGNIFIGNASNQAVTSTLDTSIVPENTNLYYTDARVDSHLNQSNPTAGYVLSWSGSDYAWISNTGYTSFNTDFDTRLATKDTGDLSEGTNLYYTDARARASISATGSLGYNSTTGVISYTQPTNVSTFSNDAGYITASSTDTLTNKSGNISMFTNDAGYLTSETDSQTLSFTSPNLSISNGNSVDLSTLEVDAVDGGTY